MNMLSKFHGYLPIRYSYFLRANEILVTDKRSAGVKKKNIIHPVGSMNTYSSENILVTERGYSDLIGGTRVKVIFAS